MPSKTGLDLYQTLKCSRKEASKDRTNTLEAIESFTIEGVLDWEIIMIEHMHTLY